MKIYLKNDIDNVSLQVGDTAYFVTPQDTQGLNNSSQLPKKIGTIDRFGDGWIEIDTVFDLNNIPTIDDFIMFQKDVKVNNTSLLGYYTEVTLKNNSTEQAELFALSSEAIPSSK